MNASEAEGIARPMKKRDFMKIGDERNKRGGRACVDVDLQVLRCDYENLPVNWNLSSPTPRPFWRWYWFDEPGVFLESAATRRTLTPDRFALIPPETPITRHREGSKRTFFIHFDLGLRFHKNTTTIYEFPLEKSTRTMMNEFIALISDGLPHGNWSYYDALRLHELILSSLTLIPRKDWLERPSRDERALNALELMRNTIESPADNAALAKSVGMSVNAFIRLFTNQTGVSPQAFFVKLRMNRAATLLSRTSLSVEAVAEKCGYSDRGHFSKTFSRHMGRGPGAYRKPPH